MSELSYWINDDTSPADAVARARQVDSDEWIEFVDHFYQSCCDCGLTHRINIRNKTVGKKEVQFVRRDDLSCLMRDRLGKARTDALDAQAQEIARLTHDIERHVAIASEHATECETLRARLATIEAKASDATEYVLAQINKDLRARLAEAERDAERYRWLRAPTKSKISGLSTSNLMLHSIYGGKFASSLDLLDSEIDAARGGA